MRSSLKSFPTLQTGCAALLIGAAMIASPGHAADSSPDITGVWHSIDDKTGFEKSIIRIYKATDGTYGGAVLKVLAPPGQKPEEICVDCPAPFTSKPINGLNILWGLKPEVDDSNTYAGGRILDPLSGNIYRARIKINPDGKELNVRGFIGFSLLGRSQIWKREK